eukprot:scpid59006/ scgid35316/ Yorkie homolog; 65 kDa Yes-associated protein
MESSTTTAMAGVPAEGRAIVHERRDSEKDLNAMFERLANPSSAAAARGRPMRERKLPASFFSPSATNFCVPSAQGSNNIGHHSREGSADSSYSSQSSTMQKSPAHHFRSVSEPVQSCLSRTNTGIGIGSDDGQLPPGVQAAVTATGQRYFIDHINKTTSWEDPRQSTMYAPTSQQKRNIAAGAGGAGQTPFYQPTNSAAVAAAALAASSMQGSASSTDALRLDALSKMQALQSIEQQQQQHQQPQQAPQMAPQQITYQKAAQPYIQHGGGQAAAAAYATPSQTPVATAAAPAYSIQAYSGEEHESHPYRTPQAGHRGAQNGHLLPRPSARNGNSRRDPGRRGRRSSSFRAMRPSTSSSLSSSLGDSAFISGSGGSYDHASLGCDSSLPSLGQVVIGSAAIETPSPSAKSASTGSSSKDSA